jgi:hypothetical protein
VTVPDGSRPGLGLCTYCSTCSVLSTFSTTGMTSAPSNFMGRRSGVVDTCLPGAKEGPTQEGTQDCKRRHKLLGSKTDVKGVSRRFHSVSLHCEDFDASTFYILYSYLSRHSSYLCSRQNECASYTVFPIPTLLQAPRLQSQSRLENYTWKRTSAESYSRFLVRLGLRTPLFPPRRSIP